MGCWPGLLGPELMMEVEGVVGGIKAGGNGDDVAWVAKEVTLTLLEVK